ncbi:MAG: polyphosphate kinase 1 [Gammaproteobacteria bacterium]|nr:MAG: polyphosphate kinase 1 [Gammaproteobacteria bacterium]
MNDMNEPLDHPVQELTVNAEKPDLNSANYFINRHISLMQFNLRVLEQALNEDYPLLERFLFLMIFNSNMDEFFEIRLAGLKRQISFSREMVNVDGMRPKEVLDTLSEQCKAATDKQYRILNEVLLPALEKQKIRVLNRSRWTPDMADWAKDYFRHQVMPVISPIGLDPAHPFPRLVNKSLNFIVSLEGKDAFGRDSGMAIVPAPRSLPRLVRVPDEFCKDGDNFVLLSSLIHAHIDDLFNGMTATGCYQFRITRDADLDLNAAEVEDIARALRGELHSRRFGSAVRLEVDQNCPDELVNFLLEQYNLSDNELYRVDGPVNLGRMMQLRQMLNRSELLFPPFIPSIPKALRDPETTILDAVKKDDVLLYHPFQSFTPIIDLLRQAARDPAVLSIKMTLYRTGSSSEVVDALVEAARAGKEVTVVIELRARFDEEENLQLASHLQEAGAVVTYGVVGYKTHAKALLIVRRENNQLRRYVHLGTGNYHAGNARLYTDYSLLSADEDLCSDVHKIFQQLTGMGKAERIRTLFSAPFTLKKNLVRLIEAEAEAARQGKDAHIIFKVNALTEPKIITSLYEASIAGVKIDLIVRGMCCLRPGVEGISENIRVRSIVGRFLEHSRVYYFHNANPGVYCASADAMERNLLHRVEICFPILSGRLQARIRSDLQSYLQDNCQSWELLPDGSYQLNQPASGEARLAAQMELLTKLTD